MGPEYTEMIQKEENALINNSLIVGDSFTEKSSNGDDSILSHDENNGNNSQCSSEDLSSASSDDYLLNKGSEDVKYYVTAGNSPLSVVIKRCNNPAYLSEDSCSNNLDRVLPSSSFQNPLECSAEPSDPESDSQDSRESINQCMSRNPCSVIEYVETIKSLVEMGLSVAENDQCDGLRVITDGSKSLVEILQGSQNTEDKDDQVNEAVNEQQNTSVTNCFHRQEHIEEVTSNSETANSGLPDQTDNFCNQLPSIDSSPICKNNLPLNTNKNSYNFIDRSSQSTSTELARESGIETRNFIFEDSRSSPQSVCLPSEIDILQFQVPINLCHEATVLTSDCETFDSQLEATNSFDDISLIDSGVDRIVYSPTLFSDDEDTENSLPNVLGVQKKSPSDVFCRRSRTTEARRLKQLQLSMNGLPPPPSVTNPQLSVDDILRLLQENNAAMVWSETSSEEKELQAKLLQDAKECAWPDSASFCYPDMYFNSGVRSEQFALLSQKFIQRYVGAETACFCNVAGTMGSARKRNKKLGAGLSPGRRLSHLARRRKAFSRDNLMSANAGSVPKSQPNALTERRQIVIDPKTKPGLNRPLTSKPSLNFKSAVSSGLRVLSHKRALFQSPDESKKSASTKKSQSGSKRKNSFRTGVESFKRALFGSVTKDKELLDAKSSRNGATQPIASSSKRKLLFDNTEGPSRMPSSQFATSSNSSLNGKLHHPGSSSTKKLDTKSILLNSGHKKKLLWAVAESLRKKGITMSHALFRPCASSLARICRSLLPDLQRHNGSTSELMLEIADKYASDIVREKKAEANTL